MRTIFKAILSWTDPSLEAAIQNAGMENVRFPGGDTGNFWDWQQGTCIRSAGRQMSGFSSRFISLNQATVAAGLQPEHHELQQRVDNQGYAFRRHGLPDSVAPGGPSSGIAGGDIDIELGNEFYWSGPDHDHELPPRKTTDSLRTVGGQAEAIVSRCSIRVHIFHPQFRRPADQDLEHTRAGKHSGIDAVTINRWTRSSMAVYQTVHRQTPC